jgi:parvulin-like peptidyl-prolyl isomerase
LGDAGRAGNAILAQGTGFEIRRSDLDQVLATARANDPRGELPPDAEIRALTHLIEIQLVLTHATQTENSDGKRSADARVAYILKTLSPSDMQVRLNRTQMTEEDLRLSLSREMTARDSLTRQLGIHVTDADAKKFFDSNPGAYDSPAIARIREILLLTTSDYSTSAAPPLPAPMIQAKRAKIDALLKRIRSGEDFAALAEKYNEDPVSKDAGGVLAFTKDQMEFSDLAFSMKQGQISGVLTNQDGFRIFQLIEIIPPKKGELAAVAAQIKSGLIADETKSLAPAYIKRLWKEAGVEIIDPKLKAGLAANEAENEANAIKAAEADAKARAEADSPAQKAAEARVFGEAASPSPAGQ